MAAAAAAVDVLARNIIGSSHGSFTATVLAARTAAAAVKELATSATAIQQLQ